MTAKVFIALRVSGTPEEAFQVFTDQVDHWWKREPRYRFLARRTGPMKFEEADGKIRLCQIYERRPDIRADIATADIWQPGKRLRLNWRWPEAPDAPVTHVDIRFSPAGDGTRITLDHLGLEALPANHPARNGLNDNRFKPVMAHFWRALLISFRNHIDLNMADHKTGV